MKTLNLLLIFIVTISHSLSAKKIDEIHKWDVYTVAFKNSNPSSNPYKEIPVKDGNDLLKVHFKGISGEAKGKELSLTGFWDGENMWKVNFSAPYSGKWTFESSSTEKSMNKVKGSLNVIDWTNDELEENSIRRGHIQVRQNGDGAGHIFEYPDGTPFLWIADTWWNWTKESIHFETYQGLVDNRAEKGFNIGQLFVPGNGLWKDNSLLDSTYSKLDIELIKKVEKMVQYANSKGITMWIHGWWSRGDINKSIGAEKIMRWQKYLINRFAAYNVIWVLAGEYNMDNYGGFSLDFWKEYGEFIRNEDPYNNIISAHNTPPTWKRGNGAPQWSTGSVLHNEPWLDYNQCQVGHGRYANEMIPLIVVEDYKRVPAKPIVVTEPWYEFIEGNPTGRDIRFGAWSSILSGAAGHTYGGGHIWRANVPESPTDPGFWPMEEGYNRTTFDYKGAVSMGILADFFSETEWYKMQPHPELISFYPQPFCLAKPGEEYVVYLRYGGNLRINLTKSAIGKTYEYYWMNAGTGQKFETKTIEGQEEIQLKCKETYPGFTEFKDWVLHIRLK